jgi:SET domain-containing protein
LTKTTKQPATFIRGKLRIGFVSVKEIKAGEEVVWDYGDRDKDIPWLSGGKSLEMTIISCINNIVLKSTEKSVTTTSPKKSTILYFILMFIICSPDVF